ncbi:Proline-rich receptor-like protein kinase perk8 [Orobanche gracilis]
MQVADFGLAKLAGELELHTHVSTRVMGTFDTWLLSMHQLVNSLRNLMIFSFGVVLLELITGRKPVDSSQPLGDESLVEWVTRPLMTEALDKEEFGELVDSRLEDNFVPSEMFRMIEAAAACVRHLASKRPKMSQQLFLCSTSSPYPQKARALDSMEELVDLNNGMKPGQSGIFSSREQSAQIKMFQRNSIRESRLQLRILQQFSKQLEKLTRDSASAYIRSCKNCAYRSYSYVS